MIPPASVGTLVVGSDSGGSVRRLIGIAVVALGTAAVAGCTGVAGSSADAAGGAGTTTEAAANQAGFARFSDIPMPPKNSIDLDRTIVFGTERDWIGRIALSSSLSVSDTYDFYKREMPRYGWTELTSVRSATSVLSYQLDNRIATIQVSGQRFGGATIDFWMNPRAGTGASTVMSSTGGIGTPAAAPRGSVQQAPLAPIR